MDIQSILYEGYAMMDDPTFKMADDKLKILSDYILLNLDFKETKPNTNTYIHVLALMMILLPSVTNPIEWKMREVMTEMPADELLLLNEHFRAIADSILKFRD